MDIVNKTKKISFCDYSRNFQEDGVEMTMHDVFHVLKDFNYANAGFIVIEVNTKETVQFYGFKDKIVAEVLDGNEDMIAKSKYVNDEEIFNIILDVFGEDVVKRLEDYYLVPIESKTLDQVMAEHKETRE